jgi:large subunit ribosomal protein L25
MNIVSIKAEKRDTLGTKTAASSRKEGKIPAVMYGGGEVVHMTVSPLALRPLVYTPDFKVVEINVDDKKETCIVKDVQFNPLTDEIQHVDFLKLIDGTPVKIELPISFQGTSPGVKNGGVFIKKLRRIKVKALPEKLTDVLNLDVSELELGHSIRVKDIQQVEGLEIMNNPNIPVASVEVPRVLKTEEEGEEGEEGAEEEDSSEESGE